MQLAHHFPKNLGTWWWWYPLPFPLKSLCLEKWRCKQRYSRNSERAWSTLSLFSVGACTSSQVIRICRLGCTPASICQELKSWHQQQRWPSFQSARCCRKLPGLSLIQDLWEHALGLAYPCFTRPTSHSVLSVLPIALPLYGQATPAGHSALQQEQKPGVPQSGNIPL